MWPSCARVVLWAATQGVPLAAGTPPSRGVRPRLRVSVPSDQKPQPYRTRSRPEVLRTVAVSAVPLPPMENIE